jgi:hypothetical protein
MKQQANFYWVFLGFSDFFNRNIKQAEEINKLKTN